MFSFVSNLTFTKVFLEMWPHYHSVCLFLNWALVWVCERVKGRRMGPILLCESVKEQGKRPERQVLTGPFIFSCHCPQMSFLSGHGNGEPHIHCHKNINSRDIIAPSKHLVSWKPQQWVFFTPSAGNSNQRLIFITLTTDLRSNTNDGMLQ